MGKAFDPSRIFPAADMPERTNALMLRARARSTNVQYCSRLNTLRKSLAVQRGVLENAVLVETVTPEELTFFFVQLSDQVKSTAESTRSALIELLVRLDMNPWPKAQRYRDLAAGSMAAQAAVRGLTGTLTDSMLEDFVNLQRDTGAPMLAHAALIAVEGEIRIGELAALEHNDAVETQKGHGCRVVLREAKKEPQTKPQLAQKFLNTQFFDLFNEASAAKYDGPDSKRIFPDKIARKLRAALASAALRLKWPSCLHWSRSHVLRCTGARRMADDITDAVSSSVSLQSPGQFRRYKRPIERRVALVEAAADSEDGAPPRRRRRAEQ